MIFEGNNTEICVVSELAGVEFVSGAVVTG